MHNKWFILLKQQIEYDYKQYENIEISQKDKLLLEKSNKHIKIIIKNNKIINKLPKEDLPYRIKNILTIFTLAITYSNKYNLPKITGEFFVRVSDGYDYKYNYPTINYAKPKTKKGFLMPDFNFRFLKDKIKMFDKQCNVKKRNLIYFKGSSTSNKKTQIMEKMSLLDKPFSVSVNTQYKPYYHLCYYKYILDLPGLKPWSVRLIELYMSKSLPIRVLFYNSKWGETEWIQFYERGFPPLVSYIPLVYDINYDIEIPNDIVKNIEFKCLQIIKFFNSHNELYNEITKKNYLKTKALNIEHIEYYMYYCCMYYLKLLSKTDS